MCWLSLLNAHGMNKGTGLPLTSSRLRRRSVTETKEQVDFLSSLPSTGSHIMLIFPPGPLDAARLGVAHIWLALLLFLGLWLHFRLLPRKVR